MITDLYDQIFNMGGYSRDIWAGFGLTLCIVVLMVAASCRRGRGGDAEKS